MIDLTERLPKEVSTAVRSNRRQVPALTGLIYNSNGSCGWNNIQLVDMLRLPPEYVIEAIEGTGITNGEYPLPDLTNLTEADLSTGLKPLPEQSSRWCVGRREPCTVNGSYRHCKILSLVGADDGTYGL